MRSVALVSLLIFCSTSRVEAQFESVGLATGWHYSEATRPTAAFAASAGVHAGVSWLLLLQRSLAELDSDSVVGNERDISLALMPVWQPFGGRIFAGIGVALNERRVQLIDAPDTRKTGVRAVATAGMRLPIAGEGLAIELTGRADHHENVTVTALFGVRARFGAIRNLQFGEPATPASATGAAVWNDVLMQLILLQQSLESFTRIKEIETGIELEFEMGHVTLWDDVAKVGRVLAAAQPPVTVTTFGPNAGRVAAAVTAGTFPPERLKLQRADRVYLRVEH